MFDESDVWATNCYVSLNPRYRVSAFTGEESETYFLWGPDEAIEAQLDEVATFLVGGLLVEITKGGQ